MTCLTNERTRLITSIDLAVKQKNRIALLSHDVYNCQIRLDTCMPDSSFSALSVLKTAASLVLMYMLAVFCRQSGVSALADAVRTAVRVAVMIPVMISCTAEPEDHEPEYQLPAGRYEQQYEGSPDTGK